MSHHRSREPSSRTVKGPRPEPSLRPRPHCVGGWPSRLACQARGDAGGGAMRVLCADATAETTVDQLTDRGHTCVVEPDLKATDLAERIKGYDVLVVRSTKVKADVF